ncbi:MAG: oligosaccharide flippase family protein [Synergistes sp.]|nr:oligosaccharide flippase family protein [Synergistes sp.]
MQSIFGNRTLKNSMLAQASLVGVGTIAAYGLDVLFMPVLSRVYSPEDFGVLSVTASAVSLLMPFSTMRYYLSIVLPKTRRYTGATIVLSCVLAAIFSFLLFSILLLFGGRICTFFGMGKITDCSLFIPLWIFFYAVFMIFTQLAIRESEFGLIAETKIIQSLSDNIVKICTGMFGMKPFGLFVGTIIGYASAMSVIIKKLAGKNGLPGSCVTDVKRAALKYRKFPRYDVLTACINVAGTQLIPILVFTLFGARASGFFVAASKLLIVPLSLLGNGIGQVFLQRAVRAKYEGGLAELTLKTYKTLLMFTTFPIAIFAIFAPHIFQTLLGAKWLAAGIYCRALAFYTIFSFCFMPISFVYSVSNEQDKYMRLEIFYSILGIAVFLLVSRTGNPQFALLCLSITAGLGLIFCAYCAMRVVRVDGRNFFKTIGDEIIHTALLCAPVMLFMFLTKKPWLASLSVPLVSIVYLKRLLREHRNQQTY